MMNQTDDQDMASARLVLTELIIGIIIFLFAECLLGMIISQNYKSYVAGALFGSLAAALFSFHMFHSIDKALDMDEKGAVRYTKTRTVVRMILMGAVIIIAFTFHRYINVIMTFTGLMNAKFSAYLQPITDKYIVNKLRKVRKC